MLCHLEYVLVNCSSPVIKRLTMKFHVLVAARNEPNSVIYVQTVVLVVLIRVQGPKSVRVPVTGDISIPC